MWPIAKRRTLSQSGLSLVELLVAMAIFVTLIGSLIVLFTTVINTVRRSYRTMDIYERARGALLSVERDLQLSFGAPAAGKAFSFYGESYGFVLIGIGLDQRLGRLTYVVHRDTSRISMENGRGIFMTLLRPWQEMEASFKVAEGDAPSDTTPSELSNYYPGSPGEYVNFEVEITYGVLLRFFEDDISNLGRFPLLENLLPRTTPPYLRRPVFTSISEAVLGAPERFPWLSTFLWENATQVSVPWYVREAIQTAETCHYWLQLLQGPTLRPIRPWALTQIWWRPIEMGDQFWFDPYFPVLPSQNQRLLWDYVVAEGFILETYLLDPITKGRILTRNGNSVPVIGPNPYLTWNPDYRYDDYPQFDPIFRYAVENNQKRVTEFNTLYNLDHLIEKQDNIGNVVERFRAFERLSKLIYDPTSGNFNLNPAGPMFDETLGYVTEVRQFYDVGSPLQVRLPASLDITFWVINDLSFAGAPPDLFRFSQTVQIQSGMMRRSRAY